MKNKSNVEVKGISGRTRTDLHARSRKCRKWTPIVCIFIKRWSNQISLIVPLYSSINSFFVFKVSQHFTFMRYSCDISTFRNPNCLTSPFLLSLLAIFSLIRFLLLILQSKPELWTELDSKSYLVQNTVFLLWALSFIKIIYSAFVSYPHIVPPTVSRVTLIRSVHCIDQYDNICKNIIDSIIFFLTIRRISFSDN